MGFLPWVLPGLMPERHRTKTNGQASACDWVFWPCRTAAVIGMRAHALNGLLRVCAARTHCREGMMSVTQFVFLFSMLGPVQPDVPPDLKQAEMQGLHRLNAAELRQLSSDSATRHIDRSNDTYCYTPSGKTQEGESCLAVFRAADGTRYFGYDIERGGHPRVWRAPQE
jgi:hypothetical protein